MRVRVIKPSGASARLIRAVWAPSLLRRLLRHRTVWGVLALLLAVMVSLSISNRVHAVEEARDEWGATATVVVMDSQLAPGERIADNASLHQVPIAMMPPGALSELPLHALAKVALFAGEIVIEDRVTTSATSGFPAGFVALTMPVQVQVPLLEVGDLVDVWTVDPTESASHQVAAGALVLAFTDDDVTIAIPEAQVAAVTVASLRPVTITLIG